MIAFVLSGGAARGALQAGALRAFVESGITPDFFVATSVGALNSLYLASRGMDLDSMQGLEQVWKVVRRRNVYPGGALSAAFRFMTGKDGLYGSDQLRKFMAKQLPSADLTFGDLQIPCYFTTADLRTQRLYLFGEYPSANCLEAAMASSSVPVLHPPMAYENLQLVDGGILENVPAEVAMSKGATVVYVFNVGFGGQRLAPAVGVLNIFSRTVQVMMAQSLFQDLAQAEEDPAIQLHHVHLNAFPDTSLLDFSRSRQMLAAGLQAGRAYLQSPSPLGLKSFNSPVFSASRRIPGGREWHSRFLRMPE